ncbi:MAG: hypothetical protein AB7D51_16120 [Desulfovibrionaceae bacterium]|jgi:hypothetical protein
MNTEPEIHDLRAISCGLVPEIARVLQAAEADVVELHIKQGMRLEIVSSFGTDPDWELKHESHIGLDVARFTRRARGKSAAGLNVVDY